MASYRAGGIGPIWTPIDICADAGAGIAPANIAKPKNAARKMLVTFFNLVPPLRISARGIGRTDVTALVNRCPRRPRFSNPGLILPNFLGLSG
jgi:hypothetical protein